jgi:RND family efflux transporter MFP subunit
MTGYWKVATFAVAAGALAVYLTGGPDAAMGRFSSEAQRIGAQLKSDASGSLRPATTPASAVPGGTTPAKGGPPGPGTPQTVSVSKPLITPVTEWDEYTGRFDATESVEIRTRVSGFLVEIHFKDGQNVKKGDLLYTLDARPFERALDQARAELTQAVTKVESTTLDVERGKPLVDRKVMSEKVFDDRANALREAQSAVKTSEAKVKTAELDVSSTKISAPFTGRISRSAVPVGAWVSAGAVANSTLLTTVVTEDPIHIYFDVNENNWIKYRRLAEQGKAAGAGRVGAKVELGLPDEKGFPTKGTVDFVDNRLDLSTGTMRARAVVDNKTGLYSAGMFARVRVQGTESYEAVMIPDEAVGTDQTNKFALVVAEDGMVSRKPLVLGPVIDGLRVIRQGLAKDDVVVIKGLQRARAGTKVAMKDEPIKLRPVAAPPATSSGLTGPVQPPIPETPATKSATAPAAPGAAATKKQ